MYLYPVLGLFSLETFCQCCFPFLLQNEGIGWVRPKTSYSKYEPNMTRVSDQCLSLAENLRIGKREFSAGFHNENDLFKNPSTNCLWPTSKPLRMGQYKS